MNTDRCKKSCCWVPFDGVCGRKRTCACHRHPELVALETIPDATTEEEVW